MVAASELPINTGATAIDMAEAIMGAGVTVVSATYTGDNRASGTYSGGDATSPFATPGDTGVILSTGRARDFTNSSGQSNQDTNTSTNTRGVNNNADFNAAAGARTYDAAYLDIQFIPTGNMMTMQFTFSSEEFPEYASSQFQDFVGVWVNGVLVQMSIGGANPGNLVGGVNQNLYLDNTGAAFNTEMDGLTVTMTLTFAVTPGVINSIRIGIADVSDSGYDSNLLIAGDSVQTVLIAQDDALHLQGHQTKTIDILENDYAASGGTLTITHINGQAVSAGDTITLPSGQTVTLNADGSFTVVGDGTDEDFNFTYTITDGVEEDTGFVIVDAVPCFVAGTRIQTERGLRPVEELQPGDRVMTRDQGLQELRWVGQRRVLARGSFAPIHIAPGTFGDHGAVALSPLHRVLIEGAGPELMFGEDEVLIEARDLVDGHRVRRVEGEEVSYLHLLFDRHQIVSAEGLASESFLPGPQMKYSFEADMVAEISGLFPGFDPESGQGYGPAARRILKRFEAQLLAHAAAPRTRAA